MSLDPTVNDALIRDEIQGLLDQEAWDEAVRAEERQRALLEQAAERWTDVAAFVQGSS